MIRLMNSAVMPAPGIYHAIRVTPEKFAESFRANIKVGGFNPISAIRKQPIISRDCSVKRLMFREQTELNDGDILYICKLACRLQNPATKGEPQPEDWEYLIVNYRKDI